MVRKRKANVRAMKTNKIAMFVFMAAMVMYAVKMIQSQGTLDSESALEVDEEVHTNPERTV
jgi:hypothetical protein